LDMLARHRRTFSQLAKVSQIRFNPESGRPAASAATVVALPDSIAAELASDVKTVEIVLPLEGIIDFREEERRLNREMDKLSRDLAQAQKKLANEDFLAKAPAEVVEKEKERLQTCTEKLSKLKSHQKRLRQLMT
jgi:valyl-tRNA synthetase